MDRSTIPENRKKACEVYVEQTKLLFTLASTFIAGPAILELLGKTNSSCLFILSEGCFILSALIGYVVLATITGSIDRGDYDVYRNSTRITSLVQFSCFLIGVILFLCMIGNVKTEKESTDKQHHHCHCNL